MEFRDKFAELTLGQAMAASKGPVSAACPSKQATVGGRVRSRTMKKIVNRFAKDESGATAIEYGLIAALISVVIIGVLSTIGTRLSNKFNQIADQLQ
jgi:pilus assembly protein Flp/PilA